MKWQTTYEWRGNAGFYIRFAVAQSDSAFKWPGFGRLPGGTHLIIASKTGSGFA